MAKAARWAFAVALIATCAVGNAQTAASLSIQEAVQRVLEHDTTVQRAELARSQAQAARNSAYANLYPQITLSSTTPYPLYGFARTTPPALPGSDPVAQNRHQVGAQLSLSQVLPTDGLVSLGVGNVMTVTKLAEDPEDESVADPTIGQTLGLTLGIQQPLFTNGRIIDLRVYSLAKRLQADIPVEKADLQARSQVNTRLVEALNGYVEVVYLRGKMTGLDANIQHSEKRLEQAALRARQGSITQRDLWDAELELDKLRDARLETRFGLLQTEQVLGVSLGYEGDLGQAALEDTLPVVTRTYTAQEVESRLVTSSPDVRRLNLAVEEARILETLHGREHAATFTASLSLSPQYAGDRESSDAFGASYADLFAEGATWNTSLSLGLSVPLFDHGKATHQRDQDRLTIQTAELSLQDMQETLRQSVQSLFLERQMLDERLRSRVSGLELELERQRDRQRLLELERITMLDLEEGATVVAGKALEVWYTRAKLFLNTLRILSLAGEDLVAVLQG